MLTTHILCILIFNNQLLCRINNNGYDYGEISDGWLLKSLNYSNTDSKGKLIFNGKSIEFGTKSLHLDICASLKISYNFKVMISIYKSYNIDKLIRF